MVDLTQVWDVVVAGGGNAALCAAITARRAGATVLGSSGWCLTKSVYLALHQSQPNAPMLEAPDRPRWTEAPSGGVGVGLLWNVRFRRVFWEARAGRRWWKGR